MPWWSWRPGHASGGEPDSRSGITVEGTVRVGPPAPREPGDDCLAAADRPVRNKEMSAAVAPVTLGRVCEALDLLDVRYLADGDGNLLAMWERHAVLVTLEGPEDEILVMRARPHATVPPDWADRAYRVVNEWNHTRRFCKAYIGDPTERGQLPIYAELQVPLGAGVHDALLVEVLDCGAAVATNFVDWLHDEGALL
ncbi:YbjN domain-containing protein [Micromonospora sp. WMMD882]|uniref:YbjN domain-containing protein n=1 Tax=Micromonospora sp. WMMD882 TaxID=3015151 RepID=UPI00248D392F|nr:YbjN domain-containing protein [Micromonospora sp. WMMD882]WBB79592.1 YbjN domain-containing protein [Micromonospora sp. WMMD882]